jgi:hypothetical protein
MTEAWETDWRYWKGCYEAKVAELGTLRRENSHLEALAIEYARELTSLMETRAQEEYSRGVKDCASKRSYGKSLHEARAEAAEATIRELREALLRLGCDCGAHEHHRPHHSSCAASSALRALAPDSKAP